MEEVIQKIYEDNAFIDNIKEILENDTVKKMNNYRQHYQTSCFDHCLMVAYYCYIICKKLHLDYISCARAAMVHDLFLYDWRKRENGRKGFHAFTHPRMAYKNASKLFELNPKEKDIILKHMWPVTFILPKYRESYIITLVDKYCAIKESSFELQNKLYQKKIFHYTYIFFSLLIMYI